MKITFDNDGEHMPDCKVLEYVKDKIEKQEDIHTSQDLVIMASRAYLYQKYEPDTRPKVEWIFYGKNIEFDDNLKPKNYHYPEEYHILDEILWQLMPKG